MEYSHDPTTRGKDDPYLFQINQWETPGVRYEHLSFCLECNDPTPDFVNRITQNTIYERNQEGTNCVLDLTRTLRPYIEFLDLTRTLRSNHGCMKWLDGCQRNPLIPTTSPDRS